jgi:hypothetical protein
MLEHLKNQRAKVNPTEVRLWAAENNIVVTDEDAQALPFKLEPWLVTKPGIGSGHRFRNGKTRKGSTYYVRETVFEWRE